MRVTESDAGAILSVGRRMRSIPAALKRALLRRDCTCRYPDGTARSYHRHGVLIPAHPKPRVGVGVGLGAIRDANDRNEVVITPDTNRSRWDGGRVRYDWCVSALC